MSRSPQTSPSRTVAGRRLVGACFLLAACVQCAAVSSSDPSPHPPPLSPAAIVSSPDGATLYLACATAAQVLELDAATGRVLRRTQVPEAPSGLALSRDGTQLIVTSAAASSSISILDTRSGQIVRTLAAGYHAMAPVLSPDGATLFVCNRFNHEVQIFDLTKRRAVRRVPVGREPVAMDITPDGRKLVVANHLPQGRADAGHVGAVVSVIDTGSGLVTGEIRLPSGSTLLRGIAAAPDGRIAAVTHLLSRFRMPTTQLERGWVTTNALTLIDLVRHEILNTVLLDDIEAGAANPWAVRWSPGGRQLLVTHAGTHELSIIDAPALLARLGALPATPPPGAASEYARGSLVAADVPNDLSFIERHRRRIKLPAAGPRALAVAGSRVFVPGYFSDTLAEVDLNQPASPPRTIPLGPPPQPTAERRGEFAWNDATLSFQGWLSCASCHSSDAHVDGLNWDNLNDGLGNAKNTKSMIMSFLTPPTTALGVRANAHVSVRAGIRNILFTAQPGEVARDLDAFLLALKPMPSPHLIAGARSPAARRGERLFRSQRAGCSGCHEPPLFTNMKAYDVGTRNAADDPQDKFDVPTLIELWRSGPYLHDGSAATVRDVLTTRNTQQKHGGTAGLTAAEIDDLCAYVLSL